MQEESLGLAEGIIAQLIKRTVDKIFHIADLTDFRESKQVIEANCRSNVFAINQMLSLVEQLNVKEFNYVGSAYACVYNHSVVLPDLIPSPKDAF